MPVKEFTSIEYLVQVSPKAQEVATLLKHHRILELLAPYQPVLTGSIPLGIDIDTSDLDIICCCSDPDLFQQFLIDTFSSHRGFDVEQKMIRKQTGNENRACFCTSAGLEWRPVRSDVTLRDAYLAAIRYNRPWSVTA